MNRWSKDIDRWIAWILVVKLRYAMSFTTHRAEMEEENTQLCYDIETGKRC